MKGYKQLKVFRVHYIVWPSLNIKFPKSEGVPHEEINPMLLKKCHAKE
jgi:hypothetical protein